jgi:hypothetical protein
MTTVAVIHSAFEETARTVAFVEVGDRTGDDALEYAYHRTNNVGGSWSREAEFEFNGEIVENPDFSEDVTVMAELPVSKRTGEVMGLRSTSMGDRMLLGTETYEVMPFGFKKVSA